MIEVFVVAVVFGTTFGFLGNVSKQRHRERMKKLELAAAREGLPAIAAPAPLALGAVTGREAELRARIEHLETIVCNVDFELNAKLNRLATQRVSLPATELAGAAVRHVAPGFEPGERVADRFVIERPLGRGGMGAVYLAQDERLNERVALKIIGGMSLLDPSAAERFRREASAARRISHPNIVRIHDIGEAEGVLFLSMEYVSGSSLAELVSRHGHLPLAQTRSVVSQILDGLGAAHDHGVVHRDLKPPNVLLDSDQRVRIIDFGLARMPHIEGMTATGMLLGTPEYMAPEQIKSGHIGPASDLYSVAALTYHLLTGRPPFTRATPIAVTLAHLTDTPRDPAELIEGLPESWSQFVLRGLAKLPEERFSDAKSMRDALPSS